MNIIEFGKKPRVAQNIISDCGGFVALVIYTGLDVNIGDMTSSANNFGDSLGYIIFSDSKEVEEFRSMVGVGETVRTDSLILKFGDNKKTIEGVNSWLDATKRKFNTLRKEAR